MRQVASDYAGLNVREVNVLEAADRMAEYRVMSTPFIVMNGTLEFVGVPKEPELRDKIQRYLGSSR